MRHENINQLAFLKRAFEFAFKNKDQARWENDRFPMSFTEKIGFVLDHLRSKTKMNELVLMFSSFNYGAHLLNSVFPKADNPEEFHSKNGAVFLEEHPVQVMGQKEYEEQIQLGISMGFKREYIIWGFNRQANERGIDLEWSFHAVVPKKPNMTGALPARGKE